jgi:hypothetical protein
MPDGREALSETYPISSFVELRSTGCQPSRSMDGVFVMRRGNREEDSLSHTSVLFIVLKIKSRMAAPTPIQEELAEATA